MPIQMIELEEVMMFEVSDDALEESSGGGTANASCPALQTCGFCEPTPFN